MQHDAQLMPHTAIIIIIIIIIIMSTIGTAAISMGLTKRE
jgi:hypothetical protein